ncbi:hypothetical protein JCM8115_003078 [Rhodotorula mucilaginosa]|nr:hypothetical protein B0A53_01754 [Rhodotorula sp. CCFEE 5036]
MSHNLPQLVTPPAAAAAIASSSAAAAAGGQKPATSSFRRKILTQNDMAQWTQSEAYTNIERFIIRLRDASTRPVSQSELVKRINALLKKSTDWLDGSASPSSTGKAFQAWLDKLAQEADRLYHESLTPAQHVAIPELAFHLRSSFGSPARLDYGTGHELSFLAFLLILRLVGAFTAEDEPALARETFAIYLDVMKQVHKTFRLEAAGKMGIWGMDENHHLVYHWEASQTRIHPSKRPALLVAPPGAAGISYLFLSSLLHLHGDPVPATTSADASSDKSFEGLLRLYKHEVLDRLPVVQHFRFGPVLRWALPATTDSLLPSTSDDLTDEELEALNATLDRRVTADGTVAPWALPTLSGNSTPEEILERLPSPALSRNSRTASPAGGNGGEQRTAARSGSVSPRMRTSNPLPYSSSPPPSSSPSLTVGTDGAAVFGSPTRAPMPRRQSRLSICEVNANNEEEADESRAQAGGQQDSSSSSVEAIRAAIKSGNKDLVAEGDESTFDFV